MSKQLCISVRWHQAMYHGRADGGEPEWPPSPLRLFQALVAASAARWNETAFRNYAKPALHWLELLALPSIVAAETKVGATYRLYVPDNLGDKVAGAWTRGTEATIAGYRTEKDVTPLHLLGDPVVHYLYTLGENEAESVKHFETIASAARSISHLGWGIDMATANATMIDDAEVASIAGEIWKPSQQEGSGALRAPMEGTLEALIRRHESFLDRLGLDGFRPVPPLSAFRVVSYRRADDPGVRPCVAFKLMRSGSEGMAYYPATRAVTVAGMVRHAVAMAAEATGWERSKIDQFILGHRDNPSDVLPRFAFLPLPTIEPQPRNVVGGIRRVLVAEPLDAKGENIAWARRIVSGQEVVREDDGEVVAYLEAVANDGVVSRYLPRQGAKAWTTATPVALPGCDDGSARKTDKLLHRMFRHAGYSLDMVEDLEFRRVPFLRGAEDAKRYRPTGRHYLANCTMYHMQIRWKQPMRGPIALGSGRFCGLGIFAVQDF